MLGWFAACLMLSIVVAAAFLLAGDLSSPAKARLVALTKPAAATPALAASACPRPAAPFHQACPGAGGRTALVASGR